MAIWCTEDLGVTGDGEAAKCTSSLSLFVLCQLSVCLFLSGLGGKLCVYALGLVMWGGDLMRFVFLAVFVNVLYEARLR